MPLETYIPSGALAEYVQMLWYWEGYHPPHPAERILPAGMMEITINLTPAPFRIYDPAQSQSPFIIQGAMAAGARSTYFVVDTSRPMSILSAWFKPGGALSLLGAQGDELHNRHLSLELLWGWHARDLYSRLLEACTPLDRFRILEAALLHRLTIAHERHRAVPYALQRFTAAPHSLTIRNLLDEIALSPTRFIQVFREDVGMTPKQFCRVQRFLRSLKLITHSHRENRAEIALACGYYDQSHFTNEFRSFAGITPTHYAPQSREHNTNLPVFEMG